MPFHRPNDNSDNPSEGRVLNLANQITFGRLLLIPVFVVCAVAYANSGGPDGPDIRWRWATLAVFAIAAISDCIDGFIARHYNQRTLLGAVIDPIADKVLLLTAIYTLAAAPWNLSFPPWFVVLVFVRETIILLGIAFMYGFLRRVKMGPVWTSKVTAALQMACVIWILLDFRVAAPELRWLIWVTSVFMVLSTVQYVREGLRQFAAARDKSNHSDSPNDFPASTSESGPSVAEERA